MSVTVEHFAYGADDGFVSVGIAVRHRQTPGGDPRMDFVAEVDLAKDEAKGLVEALRSTNCAEFEKAHDDGGYIDVIKELYEGAWIEWHDKDGRRIREPFIHGVDGWSERFAEDIDRAMRGESRCRQSPGASRHPPSTTTAGGACTTGARTGGRTGSGTRSAASAESSASSTPASTLPPSASPRSLRGSRRRPPRRPSSSTSPPALRTTTSRRTSPSACSSIPGRRWRWHGRWRAPAGAALG